MSSDPRAGWAAAAAAAAIALIAPSVAQAQWTAEAVPGTGALNPLALMFDARGHGLFTWEGLERSRRFTALDTRDAAGVWRRGPNLPGLTWGGARVYPYGSARALLISRQTASVGRFGRARWRLVYALGRSDGRFGALRPLAAGVAAPIASAANAAGAALVAYSDDRSGATWISERAPGGAFTRARPLAAGGAGGAAINAGGDRLLAWWGRAGVYVRVRRAGHGWGPALLAARATPVANATLRAAITPGGRAVVAWATADVRENSPTRIAAGAAVLDRGRTWRAFGLEHSTLGAVPFPVGTPAIPIVDRHGRVYVAWTGVVGGATAVKLAQVSSTGPRAATLLSTGVAGGAVEDAAAGPHDSLVVSWSVAGTGPGTTAVYASLRAGGHPFAPPERLTPAGAGGIAGSLAAFEPISGRAVVTWSAIDAGERPELHASLSPPS